MMNRVATAMVAAIAFLGTLRAGNAADEPRYTAVMVNGSRVHGPEVTDWGAADTVPKLNNQPLFGTGNPARWLRDNRLVVVPPPESFVEFIGGDRLPGTLSKVSPDRPQITALAVPAYLVVEPGVVLKDSNGVALREVRVIERMVRRIVQHRLGDDRYRPGTLFTRDGRKIAFQRHRFVPGAVSLRTLSGIKEAPWESVAELHLPQADPWEAYYDELAALSPDLNARLFQIETTAGLVATISKARFQVSPSSQAANPDTWQHLIQPAWSVDAFAVGHREIQLRRFFAPHEAPLSRIFPMWAENRSAVHSGWRWQVNRNVFGRPLHAGKDACGWGFGIHGLSELKFPLPSTAAAFRTGLKLDDAVRDGGCVRASVTLAAGRPDEDVDRYKTLQQLYRSDLLVGSKTVFQTGDLRLPPPEENRARLLTLAVDPVNAGVPKGADPLDIRDTMNWLDPLVLLQRKALAAEVRRRGMTGLAPWKGWVLENADKVPLRRIGRWDTGPGRSAGFRFAVSPTGEPLTLSRTMTVAPQQKWLIISAAVPGEDTPPSIIEVRVDGEVTARHEVPVRQSGAEEPSPLTVPLSSLAGRNVRFEIVQRPVDKNNARNSVVDWRAIVFADHLPLFREVYEDRAAFVPLPQPGKPAPAAAESLTEGAYSGDHCVKIAPGGRFKIDLGEPVSIREHPKWGQFRYLRFTFRKRGAGHVRLELEHDGDEERKLRYFAGRGESPLKGARRVWAWSTHAELPDAWIVETRDLFSDFGQFNGNLTSVVISCDVSGHALFDHIYLGRTEEDLELVPVERIASAADAVQIARATMVKTTLDKALPAAVVIKTADRSSSGVIVSEDGLVLTAGHTVVKPGRDVTILLADGREVQGRTLGVDRGNDAAMVKITDEGQYPFVEIAAAVGNLRNDLLVAVAHPPEFEPGGKPITPLTGLRGRINALIWTNFSRPILGSGGPLLIATAGAPGEGKLIGVHSRYAWGGFLYTPIARYRESWDRLKKGESWGSWGPGAGPLLGIYTAAGDGCKISQIVPDGPAARSKLQAGDVIKTIDGQKLATSRDLAPLLARKDPGQEVKLQVDRAGTTLDVKLTLGARK